MKKKLNLLFFLECVGHRQPACSKAAAGEGLGTGCFYGGPTPGPLLVEVSLFSSIYTSSRVYKPISENSVSWWEKAFFFGNKHAVRSGGWYPGIYTNIVTIKGLVRSSIRYYQARPGLRRKKAKALRLRRLEAQLGVGRSLKGRAASMFSSAILIGDVKNVLWKELSDANMRCSGRNTSAFNKNSRSSLFCLNIIYLVVRSPRLRE